eukprot:scaffold60601_cov72-Phaeocystis_antarctica.AAC.2
MSPNTIRSCFYYVYKLAEAPRVCEELSRTLKQPASIRLQEALDAWVPAERGWSSLCLAHRLLEAPSACAAGFRCTQVKVTAAPLGPAYGQLA